MWQDRKGRKSNTCITGEPAWRPLPAVKSHRRTILVEHTSARSGNTTGSTSYQSEGTRGDSAACAPVFGPWIGSSLDVFSHNQAVWSSLRNLHFSMWPGIETLLSLTSWVTLDMFPNLLLPNLRGLMWGLGTIMVPASWGDSEPERRQCLPVTTHSAHEP